MSEPEKKPRRHQPLLKCRKCQFAIPPGKVTCGYCGAVHFGTARVHADRPDDGIKRLSEIEALKLERIKTGLGDRNWGPAGDEGICVTSLTLLGGAPGAGKSTLCSQLLSLIASVTGKHTLYVGKEESGEQVKARAMRLGLPNLDRMLILPLEAQEGGYKLTPEVFERWQIGGYVIDSLQAYSETENDSCDLLLDLKAATVKYRCPGVVISQVNKEEEFAGLNSLQHAVDALMLFTLVDVIDGPDGEEFYPPNDEATPNEPWRVLKTGKNRDGTSHESYFSMHATGLRAFLPPWEKMR